VYAGSKATGFDSRTKQHMPPPLKVVHKKKLLGLSLCVAPFGKSLHEENKPCNLYPDALQIAPGIHVGLK